MGDAGVGAAASCPGEGDLAGGCVGGEAAKGLGDPPAPATGGSGLQDPLPAAASR